MLLDPKKPKVEPIPGEQFRFWVESSDPKEGKHLVDLEARWPLSMCSCRDWECRRWPAFKKSLYAIRCKHGDAALEVYALLHIQATSKNLKNNDGE